MKCADCAWWLYSSHWWGGVGFVDLQFMYSNVKINIDLEYRAR